MTSIFKGVREYLTPVLSESAFIQRGVLTPQEFVEAGDRLVSNNATWEGCAGDEARRKPYLPPDKQYLLTRNVPCRRRVAVLESDYAEEQLVETGGGDGAVHVAALARPPPHDGRAGLQEAGGHGGGGPGDGL